MDLVKKMLIKNPDKRINIFDIKSHCWIIGTKLYYNKYNFNF